MATIVCKWNRDLLDALRARSERTILIVDGFDLRTTTVDRYAAELYYEISSFSALEELAAIAVDLRVSDENVTDVISHTEFSQYGAGVLGELLGCQRMNLSIALGTRDKREMKRRLQAQGETVAKWVNLGSLKQHQQWRRILDRFGFPVIIKPVNGFGTIATHRIDKPEQVGDHIELLITNQDPTLLTMQFMAEAVVDGDEFHADAVWRNSIPELFVVSRYFCPRIDSIREGKLNGSVTLREKTHKKMYDDVLKLAQRAIAALGITHGPTHMEFFLRQSDGCLIFSELAFRLPGGIIIEAIRWKTGFNMYHLWVVSLFDGVPEQTITARLPVTGCLNLSPRRSGRILAIPSADEIRAIKGVLEVKVCLAAGDTFDASHPSHWCVLIVLGAMTETELEEKARTITDRFPIDVC